MKPWRLCLLLLAGCGATARTYGGTPTAEIGDLLDEQFADVVRVGADCSGVVVGPRHVLTARHCPEPSKVYVGDQLELRVTDVRPAPDGIDVVILVTEQRILLPVRERSLDPADEPPTGVVRVVGFGATDASGRHGGGVRNTALISPADWRCTTHRAQTLRCTPRVEVVISGGGGDTCPGDSGGAVLDRGEGHARLIAITSRRLPGTSTTCGGGGIYVHVGAIAEWIDREVAR